jgi:hypothetical protein
LKAKNRSNEHGQTEPDASKKNACLQPQTVFNWIMSRAEPIPTRASLLERLKNADDHSSWTRFYELYYDLIFSVARRAGLSEAEAAEVVQDTLISAARKMPEFTYDPAKDSFKGWLLTVTRWRIKDLLAKGSREAGPRCRSRPSSKPASNSDAPAPLVSFGHPECGCLPCLPGQR